jgi:sulfate adenylyltransferase subunit 1 (EFTu-like GTPase family)
VIKIVFVGHVDHGKSTLIGRILEETSSLPERRIEALRASCQAQGQRFEYAFLLDALAEEQQQTPRFSSGVRVAATSSSTRRAMKNF